VPTSATIASSDARIAGLWGAQNQLKDVKNGAADQQRQDASQKKQDPFTHEASIVQLLSHLRTFALTWIKWTPENLNGSRDVE
jgi:hypothetical protein